MTRRVALPDDTLTIASFALGSLIGAIAAPPHWPRRILWAMTFAFAGLTVWWLRKPNVTPWVIALFHSGALTTVLVIGVVALIIPRGPYSLIYASNPLAETDGPLSAWKPDWSLEAAFIYLGTESAWSQNVPSGHKLQVFQVRSLLAWISHSAVGFGCAGLDFRPD